MTMEEKKINPLDIKDGVDAILPGTRFALDREDRGVYETIPYFLKPLMCDIDDEGRVTVNAKKREIPDELDFDFLRAETNRAMSCRSTYAYLNTEDINTIITKLSELVEKVGTIDMRDGVPSTVFPYISTLVGKINRAYGIEYDSDGTKVEPVIEWNDQGAPIDYLKLAKVISDKRMYLYLKMDKAVTEYITNILYMFSETEIVERFGETVYRRIVALWVEGGLCTETVKKNAPDVYKRHGKAIYNLHIYHLTNLAQDDIDIVRVIRYCDEVRNVESIMRLIRCDDVLNGINALMLLFGHDEYLDSIMPYRKEINASIRENPVEFFELKIIPTEYEKCKEITPWVDRLTWISVNSRVIDFEKEMKATIINVHEDIVPYVFAIANHVANFYEPESHSLSKEACEDYLESLVNFINAIGANSPETTLVSMTFATAMAKLAVKLKDFSVLVKLKNNKFLMDLIYILNGRKYREALLRGVTEDIVRQLIVDGGLDWGAMVANAMYFPNLYMEFMDEIIGSSSVEVFSREKFYVYTGEMNWTDFKTIVEKLPPAMAKMIDYDPRFLCFLLNTPRTNFEEIFNKYYSVENTASFIQAFGLIAFLSNRSLTVREIFKAVDVNRDFTAFMEVLNRYIDVLLTTRDEDVRPLLIGSFGCVIGDDHRSTILQHVERFITSPENRYIMTDDDRDSVLFALSHTLEDGELVPIKNEGIIARCAELCSWNTLSGVRVKAMVK